MTEQERVPRPEEAVRFAEDLNPEQIPQPLPCGVGSSTDNPCPREATTWMHPEARDYPVCAEHARGFEEGEEASLLDLAVSVVTDWLGVAKAWGVEELECATRQMQENLKEKLLKAQARADLAREIADAPRKGEERTNLTQEQDEKLRHLVKGAPTNSTTPTRASRTSLRGRSRRSVVGAYSAC